MCEVIPCRERLQPLLPECDIARIDRRCAGSSVEGAGRSGHRDSTI
jgi:hypothetical protein